MPSSPRPREAGAQIALMNPGGMRANLTGDAGGQVRYEDLFAVQPFYNNLVTMTLTGAQLQQRARAAMDRTSRGRACCRSRAASATAGTTQAAGPARRAGQREPGRRSRSSRSSACASRSTAFSPAAATTSRVFKQDGQDVRTGSMDIDALERYVSAQGTVAPVATPRVQRVN